MSVGDRPSSIATKAARHQTSQPWSQGQQEGGQKWHNRPHCDLAKWFNQTQIPLPCNWGTQKVGKQWREHCSNFDLGSAPLKVHWSVRIKFLLAFSEQRNDSEGNKKTHCAHGPALPCLLALHPSAPHLNYTMYFSIFSRL